MRTKKDIMNLIKNGLKIETVSRLSESQIKTLSEKFKKQETDEAVDTVSKIRTFSPGEVSSAKSSAQQGLFWAKCNKSKGKEKKKWCDMAREFSDSTTEKEYEGMPKKKHPEKTVKYNKKKEKSKVEEQLENEIVKLIEGHINPSMTKGDLIKVILEKTKKEDSMILRNPKKMTMFSKDEGKEMKTMKKPIGKLFSMGKEMSENTETAPVKPGTKEKTKSPGKDKNPFKRPGPKENPKAKKGKEEKKNEFISVIKQALNLM